jgi:hypothetical protein
MVANQPINKAMNSLKRRAEMASMVYRSTVYLLVTVRSSRMLDIAPWKRSLSRLERRFW